ncbi:hypothetical protein KDA_10970 [Dictyobacter alpinus]|uniref:Uncharacterized protein n=2 Tax=Dictyobacter alpinus TaxID=2014873 RepID=A0A402B2Q7_9CHLR|nr:hypothetical protein KDA_10970 [Dictyobacter alpinus]
MSQNTQSPTQENSANNQYAPWGTLAPAATPQVPQSEQGAFPAQPGQFSPAQQGNNPYQPYAASFPPVANQNQMYMPSTPSPTPSRPVPTPSNGAPSFVQPRPITPVQPRPATPKRKPHTRLGFTIAGLCFMSGVLIMIFVFIMAQSLPVAPLATTPPAPVLTQTTPEPAPTATEKAQAQQPAPTTAAATATPTVAATATVASANQYIDQTNLASSVDTRTGQPLQLTNQFHLGQSIYVTMTIHQAAYNGAVCLNWSINQQKFPYVNSASPGGTYPAQTSAYFYYKPNATGSGSVDVYWASSDACTNGVLIKHLPFTVA